MRQRQEVQEMLRAELSEKNARLPILTGAIPGEMFDGGMLELPYFELFANAAGQVFFDLTVPGNGCPRSLRRVLPDGMRTALPFQHTTIPT
jgi:hypothetical protein